MMHEVNNNVYCYLIFFIACEVLGAAKSRRNVSLNSLNKDVKTSYYIYLNSCTKILSRNPLCKIKIHIKVFLINGDDVQLT